MSEDSAGVRAAARRLAKSGFDLVRQGFALAKAELAILSTLVVLGGGAWIFFAVADEVREGETASIDHAVLRAFRNPADPSDPIGPVWLEDATREITALGGGVVLTILTSLVIGYLLIARRPRTALLVAVSVIGGMLLVVSLKAGFDRPRPDLLLHGAPVYTQGSFPSGHAMLSATVYLTLGALLTRLQAALRVRLYLLGAAVLLTMLVGCSRIYLGVHWPTDVLAGWGIGAAWAMLVWLVALALERRGKIRARSDTLATAPRGEPLRARRGPRWPHRTTSGATPRSLAQRRSRPRSRSLAGRRRRTVRRRP